MQIKYLGGIRWIWIKYFSPDIYHKYKRVREGLKERPKRAILRLKEQQMEPEYMFNRITPQLRHPQVHASQAMTSFVHSGNSGDIIYSLPTIFALSKKGKAMLYLKLNARMVHEGFHPLGGVMLNKKMADMLIPLLLHQPQIKKCCIFDNEQPDYDLDLFRSYSMLLDRGSIARWYFYVFGISAPLYKPWLIAPKISGLEDTIIVARSHRYRGPLIDYSFLSEYSKLLFIGIKEEYEDMREMLPDIPWREVNDFLEMATLINSCRLFIGNQSFPFSIAEGLKVNRLLEVYFKIPNVIPEGPGANDFMYQPQFESSVRRLYSYPSI